MRFDPTTLIARTRAEALECAARTVEKLARAANLHGEWMDGPAVVDELNNLAAAERAKILTRSEGDPRPARAAAFQAPGTECQLCGALEGEMHFPGCPHLPREINPDTDPEWHEGPI
jgi:hypothetical protein